MHGRYYCLGCNVEPHISTCMHATESTHTFINLCNWIGRWGREGKQQYKAIIFESSWISLSHTHTHAYTHLIFSDRNTDVSKPRGHLLNQPEQRQRAARMLRYMEERRIEGNFEGLEVKEKMEQGIQMVEKIKNFSFSWEDPLFCSLWPQNLPGGN